MKNKIILIGGGGHCHSVIDAIEFAAEYEIVGIVDHIDKVGNDIMSYPIIGTDDDLALIVNEVKYAFITLGQIKTAAVRKSLFERITALGYEVPNIISPLAYVSKSATLGRGNFIGHQAIVNANAVIHDNCIVNTKALIEHDAIIDSHCHIATGAIINGGCKVHSEVFVGSASTTKQGATINSKSFIKAGSVVI